MSEKAAYTVRVDGSDVTEDVLVSMGPVTASRGLDQIRTLAPPRAPRFGATVDNTGGEYNPGSTPLAAGQSVELVATHEGARTPLFAGALERPSLSARSFAETVSLSALGRMSRLTADRQPVTTEQYVNIRTGEAIEVLLDAIGWPTPALTDLRSLSPSGLWSLAEAVGDALDLSGHGNDGTVTYAEWQRGVLPSLYDRGLAGMRFEEGTTNILANPIAGAGTLTGWATDSGNWHREAVVFADEGIPNPIIDGVEVTTGFKCSVTGSGSSVVPHSTPSLTLTASPWSGQGWFYIPADFDSAGLRWQFNNFSDASGSRWANADMGKRDQWQRVEVPNVTPGTDLTGEWSIIREGAEPSVGRVLYHTGSQIENKARCTSLAVGSFGTGYSWAGTEHASASTRVATSVNLGSGDELDNIFDGGGAVAGIARITSDGEGDAGTLGSKGWTLKTVDESGGLCRLQFTVPFSGTNGVWRTARTVPVGSDVAWCVRYDADATTNDPIVSIGVAGVASTPTITETQTPVGTRTTDASIDLVVGNVPDGDETADAVLSPFAVWQGTQPTGDEIEAWFARVHHSPRQIDEGLTVMPLWWGDGSDVFAQIRRLQVTEGPGALLYEDGAGALVFRDRHARLTESRMVTSQAEYGGLSGLSIVGAPVYDDGLGEVYNACALTINAREEHELDVVWSLGSDLFVAAGESRTVEAVAAPGDVFLDAVAPDAGSGDYTTPGAAPDSVTIDRTDGGVIAITVTATSANATRIRGLRLRAKRSSVTSEVVVRNRVDASASIATYGLREWPLDVWPEMDIDVAQDFADAVVLMYQGGRPKLTWSTVNVSEAALESILEREIGDRVTVEIPRLGVDVDCHVLSRADRIGMGLVHEATFGAEVVESNTWFLLDTSELDGADLLGF